MGVMIAKGSLSTRERSEALKDLVIMKAYNSAHKILESRMVSSSSPFLSNTGRVCVFLVSKFYRCFLNMLCFLV